MKKLLFYSMIFNVVLFVNYIDLSGSELDRVFDNSFLKYISNPNYYNNKEISIYGKIKQFRHITSSNGKPYTLFKIKDKNKNIIKVYYKGEHLPIKKGVYVKLYGKFIKEKKYAIFKIKNVVKAKDVKLVS